MIVGVLEELLEMFKGGATLVLLCEGEGVLGELLGSVGERDGLRVRVGHAYTEGEEVGVHRDGDEGRRHLGETGGKWVKEGRSLIYRLTA
jgi:hypothetical protein